MTSPGPFPLSIAPGGIDSAILALCSDEARLQRLLEFESALIRALAYCGRVSPDHAAAILDACDLEGREPAPLLAAMAEGTSILSPLVARLKARAGGILGEADVFVHFGTTDNDVLDCAMKLEIRELAAIIRQSLHGTLDMLRDLAEARRDMPSPHPADMIDHLALPDGLHLAEKAALMARITRHFETVSADALALCFGSSPESLIRLNHDCDAIAERLTVELALPLSDHTPIHQRDTSLAFDFCLASIVSACSTIAHDLNLRYPEPQADTGNDTTNGPRPHQTIANIAQAVPGLVAQTYHCITANHHSGDVTQGLLTEWALSSSLALHAIGALDALRTLGTAIRNNPNTNVRQMRLNIWDGAQNYIDTQFDQVDLD